MRRHAYLSLIFSTASLIAACAATPPVREAAAVRLEAPAPAEPAPVSALVAEVAIPHSSFRLDNGLTVIVHEDRKAPVVAVSAWYNVGSKDEPGSKTGFAHLFEHLMFNGSENLPGDVFAYLEQIGATDYNGGTSFDYTNYYETVPRGALERALFIESDRMGHLLGAVTQEVLDNQRAVVQNEKRQRDNQPGGLVFYEVLENLFPEGHPYHHSPIGSMADLDAASLADVKAWFADNYGPNNAVLVLAGDISADEARPLVAKYFGSIARGPVNLPADAAVPTLAAPRSIVMKDRIAAVQIQRYWPVPGLLDRRLVALDVAGSVLGGLASSRLDKVLVRDEQLAVGVSAGLIPLQRVGLFTVSATVKPGGDPALVERRLDQLVADYIAQGPNDDEVRRAVTSELAARINGLEQVGGSSGKAVALAEGQVYAGDSDFYKQTLAAYAGVSTAEVRSAMAEWLSRPALTIRLEPGDRPAYQDAKAVASAKPRRNSKPAVPLAKRAIPPLESLAALDFPEISHTTLSNGIRLSYAQRDAVPITQLALSFDAGFAADAPVQRGIQSFTLALLEEGFGGLTSQQIAEAKERLGAEIGAGGSADRSLVSLSALSANLAPSLDLVAAMIQRPTFAPGEINRVRARTLTAIAQAQKDPGSIASRALPALIYGEAHPYSSTGLGEAEAVTRFTRDDLVGFQSRWLRPDNLEIFLVSDRPLAEIQPLLEQRFGRWATPPVPRGAKTFAPPPPRPASPRIVLIDRPGSPQSIIYGGQITPIDPRSDVTAIASANDILGGGFLSRINMDLREKRGWSYGVSGSVALSQHAVPYIVRAPVQADRTGDSILALNREIAAFLGPRGTTEEELARTVANNINELPGRFETAGAVLSAMQTNALYGRPDNYYELLADRYRAQTRARLDSALRAAVDPNAFVWVVVGDAAKIRPQLDKLKLPIHLARPR